MATGTWKPITEPPKEDGYYMVKFYFKYRHPTDRTVFAHREFIDGVWTVPYYDRAFPEESELLEWFDESQEGV